MQRKSFSMSGLVRWSIRDLVLFTVIVALGIAWWVDHRRLMSQVEEGHRWKHRFVAANDAAHKGQTLSFDYEKLGIDPPPEARTNYFRWKELKRSGELKEPSSY